MVAQTSGVPLKLPIGGNTYGDYASFLPGVTTLNDILAAQGYRQVFMIGSDADFGGRSNYFTQHGDVELWDYKYAKEQGYIPQDYYQFWGFEDQKLYQYAQEKLLELSAQTEPFNLTLLTVDTHFYDGYVCPLCEDQWESQYENVISCADRQIADFVAWIQQQDFYENTTIVIAGDHLTMDYDFFAERGIAHEDRRIYNCFINVPSTAESTTERVFSVMDMFPSTLAALGVTWGDSRLGLGTNLFSGVQTLPELMGADVFQTEIGKTSHFYNNKFIYG